MRKKSGFTIVEQAITLVPEFENVVRKLEQQVTLLGQSKSTLQNYTSTALSAPHPAYRPFRGTFREAARADRPGRDQRIPCGSGTGS